MPEIPAEHRSDGVKGRMDPSCVAAEQRDHCVGNDSCPYAVGDAVGRRHDENRQQCRDADPWILEIDLQDLADHVVGHDDQNGRRSDRGHDASDWCQENAHQEQHADHYSCQPGPTTFFHARSAFDVGRVGRRRDRPTDDCRDRIDAQNGSSPRQRTVRPKLAGSAEDAVGRPGVVKEV